MSTYFEPTTPASVVSSATNFLLGTAANAALNAILWDTGQLAAGDYELWVTINQRASDVATALNAQMTVQHRNAANAANIRAFAIDKIASDSATLSQQCSTHMVWRRFTVALNERIRCIKDTQADAPGANTSWSVWLGKIA